MRKEGGNPLGAERSVWFGAVPPPPSPDQMGAGWVVAAQNGPEVTSGYRRDGGRPGPGPTASPGFGKA